LGFTRGLIWLEDDHYNACKTLSQVYVNNQQTYQCDHTFTWDNVGFDGPVLPRDLAFEVPDAVTSISSSPIYKNLGWYNFSNGGGTVTVTDPNVSGISQASGGLLVFNTFNNTAPLTFTYSLNGNPTHTLNWPYQTADTQTGTGRTIAIPISLSEVVTGNNTITISDNDSGGLFLYNVGLIMVGAGGPGGVVTYQ
jgi:hypothetical protein